MATVSSFPSMRKMQMPRVLCRKREKDKERGGQNSNYPYKVIEISPPPNSLGIRCFPLISFVLDTEDSFIRLGRRTAILSERYSLKAQARVERFRQFLAASVSYLKKGAIELLGIESSYETK